MKLLKVKFFSLLAMVTLIGLISSCTEKNIVEPQDVEIEATTLLSKSFDEGLSETEAEKQFGEMVENYMNTLQESEVDSELKLRGKSTEVYVVVQLTTGRQSANGTNSFANAEIALRTDNYRAIGKLNLHKPKYRKANNYYLIRIPTNQICWVELDYIKIKLHGNDDWLLEKVRVVARPDRQLKHKNSTGLSAIRAEYKYIPAYGTKVFYGQRNKLRFCH